MRILHLINNLDRGGIETWLVSMLKHISRSAYTMDVCCRGESTGSMTENVRALGVEVHHVQFGIWHVGFYLQLKELIKSGHYDILHSHMETYSGFATWIGQQLGIPVINSYHNIDTPPQTMLTRQQVIKQLRNLYGKISIDYAIKHSDYITGASKSVLQSFKVEQQDNVRVIYYGLDVPPQAGANVREILRSDFGWDTDTPIIIHVGRFYLQKNHIGLLNIFEAVQKKLPQARLLLVGDGMLRPKFEDYVRAQGLNNHVKFLGIREDIPYLLGCSDIFLMPSLFEGFGLAALEANASGLPVIASRNTGLMEAIGDGETGLLFDVDDTEGMSQALVHLLTHPDESRVFGQKGRQRATEKFSLQASARQLERLYDASYRGG